jgi:dTDP-glucose 4,6-dehydratase
MGKQSAKRILITGGAGFIGSHLADRFVAQGHSVVAVDSLITGSLDNVAHLRKNKLFSFVKKDISAPFSVAGRIDWVLNFASPASPPEYLKYPIDTLKVGAMGTCNTLEIARAKKAAYLMASTSEVYGDPLVSPQVETYWGNVNPVGPRSVYDEAKRYSEAITMGFRRHYKMDAKIIRIFNTYGRRMSPEDGRVIPNFATQAILGKPLTVYGDGSQTRSYCYVDDLTAGIQKMIESREGGPVNLGNPNEMTVLELAKLILKMTGSKSPVVMKELPVDDPKRRCPDITLAQTKLGWEPKVALRDGLAETIDYFKSKVLKAR